MLANIFFDPSTLLKPEAITARRNLKMPVTTHSNESSRWSPILIVVCLSCYYWRLEFVFFQMKPKGVTTQMEAEYISSDVVFVVI